MEFGWWWVLFILILLEGEYLESLNRNIALFQGGSMFLLILTSGWAAVVDWRRLHIDALSYDLLICLSVYCPILLQAAGLSIVLDFHFIRFNSKVCYWDCCCSTSLVTYSYSYQKQLDLFSRGAVESRIISFDSYTLNN